MYLRILEDDLTVCAQQYGVGVGQYGWSAGKASKFLSQITRDCLRFGPTRATLCHGMTDHEYRLYEDRIRQIYRQNLTAVVRALKVHGVRVIVGSPGWTEGSRLIGSGQAHAEKGRAVVR